MDTQMNRTGRRRRRRKPQVKKTAAKVEPIVALARRPDSPRLEKPTRRMKAASAKPRTLGDLTRGAERSAAEATVKTVEDAPKKRREARIVVRKEDEIDDVERNRRRLLSRYLASEGRLAVTKAANEYFSQGFEIPREQEPQLKLLEHFDESRAKQALEVLIDLLNEEPAQQLPLFRQRLRRLEDHAEDAELRDAAARLRRSLPA